MHFYGRAAAEANFSGFLSALLWTVSAFPKCAARARRARFPRARSRRRVVVAALRSVTHAARGSSYGCHGRGTREGARADADRRVSVVIMSCPSRVCCAAAKRILVVDYF